MRCSSSEAVHRVTMTTCTDCKASKNVDRLPRGWHRKDPDIYCDKCWGRKYILRAIVMEVVSPIDTDWKSLNDALGVMFKQTTAASNWMLVELAKKDVTRDPEAKKMPPMAHVYLYPDARKQFPALPSRSISSLEQAVQRKYRSKRYEIIWTCASTLPTFRYPQPFPIPGQGWSPILINDTPQVSMVIGDHRWTLRLKSGARYRRKLAAFRMMTSGQAIRGEMAIYRRDKNLLCKMVAWLPRTEPLPAEGTLTVRTGAESLLIAVNAKDERLWTYNADHVKRWAAEHRRRLQRWSEDHEAEQRPVPNFAKRRVDAALKFHDRINKAAEQIASYLTLYARRRKFAIVRYDDFERGYCPDFVWHRLKSQIELKLDEFGIKFEHVTSTPVDNETHGALGSEVKS